MATVTGHDCARRTRPTSHTAAQHTHAQPRADPTASVGEYYWGYASGVITTKVPDWGEFVLAELTQTFDHGDATYFFPLMAPPNAASAADRATAPSTRPMTPSTSISTSTRPAALPPCLSARRAAQDPQLQPRGLPLCAAGLPMPLKFTFTDRTRPWSSMSAASTSVPCDNPELQPAAPTCPVNDARWPTGGCTAMMPICVGARIRYQLDREDAYKAIYKQRTADERSNSQAVDLGIERPRLRRQSAIANQNTLIYVLINLRALQRVRVQKEELAHQTKMPGVAAPKPP